MKRNLIVLVAVLCLCSSPAVAGGGYDMFLKISGVTGEDTFQGKSGFIALGGFKVGMVDAGSGNIARPVIAAQPASFSGPNAPDLGSLEGMGITLGKELDKSTPILMSAFRDGRRFPSAKLVLCKAGDHSQVVYDFDLTGVKVTHLRESGTQQILSLNFEIIEWLSKP